jgi:CheY-like chemotaxis protein
LFLSFSQVDASMTRLYGGTGLGLAISQRLARAMGGVITVEDNPDGRGTRFNVTLTLNRCLDMPHPQGTPEMLAPVLAGGSVLLVDDNETNLRILQGQLKRLGMTCTSATSGDQAIALVQGGLKYDVGIIDMNMPDMDGAELGDSLKQIAGGSASAPLVLLTSLEWRPTGVEHSFAMTLTKPVKSARLRDVLSGLLGRGAGAAEGHPNRSASKTRRTVKGRRVLLAEDNNMNQRVLRLMLGDLGHSVDVVADGEQAVTAVTSGRYDIVLMDVQMPRMDGLEATRRIRSDLPPEEQPHIVALTASALVEDREACAEAGMEAFLTKPVRKAQLEDILRRAGRHGEPLQYPV